MDWMLFVFGVRCRLVDTLENRFCSLCASITSLESWNVHTVPLIELVDVCPKVIGTWHSTVCPSRTSSKFLCESSAFSLNVLKISNAS